MRFSLDDRIGVNVDSGLGWLSYEDVAAHLGVSRRQVERYIAAGSIPSPQYHGTLARFPLDYLERLDATGICLPRTYPRAKSPRALHKQKAVKAAQRKAKAKTKTKTKTKPVPARRVAKHGRGGKK